MLCNSFHYITGEKIATVNAFDFGKVIQGHHGNHPLVLQFEASTETTLSFIKIYLENIGVWPKTAFGYFISPTFISGIGSGSALLSNEFVEVPGATISSSNGVTLNCTSNKSEYIWIDVDIQQGIGISDVNFRIFYDYL
jgi:hypothetical protein